MLASLRSFSNPKAQTSPEAIKSMLLGPKSLKMWVLGTFGQQLPAPLAKL